MLKRMLLCASIISITLASGFITAHGEDYDLIVSVSSYDGLLDTLAQAGPAVAPQGGFLASLRMLPQSPKGVADGKPLGAVLNVGGESPDMAVFFPLEDYDDFKDWVDSVLNKDNPMQFKCVEVGNYGILSSAKSNIKLPKDPTVVLGTLPKQHLIAIRTSGAALAQALEKSSSILADQMPSGLDELKQFKTIQLGIDLSKSADIKITTTTTANDGTELQVNLKQALQMKSYTAAFYKKDADAAFYMKGIIPKSFKPSILESLESGRDNGPEPREISNGLLDILISCVKTGIWDMGFSVSPVKDSFLFAVRVADGDQVDAFLRTLLPYLAKKDSIKFNASEKLKKVTFHTFTTDPELLEKNFQVPNAKEVNVAVGIQKKYFFMAVANNNALNTLKKAVQETLVAPQPKLLGNGHLNIKIFAPDSDVTGSIQFSSSAKDNTAMSTLSISGETVKSLAKLIMASMPAAGPIRNQPNTEIPDFSDEL